MQRMRTFILRNVMVGCKMKADDYPIYIRRSIYHEKAAHRHHRLRRYRQ